MEPSKERMLMWLRNWRWVWLHSRDGADPRKEPDIRRSMQLSYEAIVKIIEKTDAWDRMAM